MFWFFGHEACGILAAQPGIEPAAPALEGEVLTIGPPGKSLNSVLNSLHCLSPQSLRNQEAFPLPGPARLCSISSRYTAIARFILRGHMVERKQRTDG